MKVLSLEKKLLMNTFKAFKYREQFLFIICGAMAASINFFSLIIFSYFFNLSLSIFFSFILGMLSAYFLFKKIVFINKKKSKKRNLPFFIVVNLIALIQIYFLTTLLNYLFYCYAGYSNVTIAHGVAILSSVFLSFYLHKNYTFK